MARQPKQKQKWHEEFRNEDFVVTYLQKQFFDVLKTQKSLYGTVVKHEAFIAMK